MESMAPFLFAGILVLVILAAIFGAIQSAKRKKELRAWAESRSLSYRDENDRSFEDRFSELDCLRAGEKSRYAYNIMEGEWRGYPVIAFDYHYATTSRDSKGRTTTHHHHFSAAIVRSKLALKPLQIRPETFFDKVGGFFGFEDINFESAEFSRSFHVKSPDRKWAYDVLHARAMQYLLDRPRVSIELEPVHTIVHGGGTWDVAEFEANIETLIGLLEQLPEYVQRDLRQGV